MLPSYRNQSIALLSKSIDWFLCEGNTRNVNQLTGLYMRATLTIIGLIFMVPYHNPKPNKQIWTRNFYLRMIPFLQGNLDLSTKANDYKGFLNNSDCLGSCKKHKQWNEILRKIQKDYFWSQFSRCCSKLMNKTFQQNLFRLSLNIHGSCSWCKKSQKNSIDLILRN